MAQAPVARCVLASRVGLRGPKRHRGGGLCGRRVGRRILQRRLPHDGRPQRAAPRHGRSVGTPVSARGGSRTRRRLPAGRASLVGTLAGRRGQRRHGRSALPNLDAGVGPASTLSPRASRPVAGNGCAARRRHAARHLSSHARGSARAGGRRGTRRDLIAPDVGHRRRRVVRQGLRHGGARRPASRRRLLALLRHRAPDGTFRAARRPGPRPAPRLRPAGGVGGGAPERRRPRRQLATGVLWRAEPDASRRPRDTGAPGPRQAIRGPRDDGPHRPRLRARTSYPGRGFDLLLAARVARARARDPGHPLRPPAPRPCPASRALATRARRIPSKRHAAPGQ